MGKLVKIAKDAHDSRESAAKSGANVAKSGLKSRQSGTNQPSEAQFAYLKCGLGQPGGKLPLFNSHGQEINKRTIQACIDKGWAEPWFANPIKAGWLVCKLTAAGYAVLGHETPGA